MDAIASIKGIEEKLLEELQALDETYQSISGASSDLLCARENLLKQNKQLKVSLVKVKFLYRLFKRLLKKARVTLRGRSAVERISTLAAVQSSTLLFKKIRTDIETDLQIINILIQITAKTEESQESNRKKFEEEFDKIMKKNVPLHKMPKLQEALAFFKNSTLAAEAPSGNSDENSGLVAEAPSGKSDKNSE